MSNGQVASKPSGRKEASSSKGEDPMCGVVIDGRYRITRPLATGGMGSVYEAQQINLDRRVAVKIMDQQDDLLLERFRREASALADVSHPAIVEVHDYANFVDPRFADNQAPRGCLIMAFIDGKDLYEHAGTMADHCMDAREVRVLFLPIVSALVELHSNGIIHRDIKPHNLVRFVRADDRPGVKLVDFGIAKRAGEADLTAAGRLVGTPPYMALEAFMGQPQTPLSDIYSLGATMFELLTGKPPHGDSSIPGIMDHIMNGEIEFPRHLAGTGMGLLLRAMLARDQKHRPDALQVLHDLERLHDPLAPEAGLDLEVDNAGSAGQPSERRSGVITAISRPASVIETVDDFPVADQKQARGHTPETKRLRAMALFSSAVAVLALVGVLVMALTR